MSGLPKLLSNYYLLYYFIDCQFMYLVVRCEKGRRRVSNISGLLSLELPCDPKISEHKSLNYSKIYHQWLLYHYLWPLSSSYSSLSPHSLTLFLSLFYMVISLVSNYWIQNLVSYFIQYCFISFWYTETCYLSLRLCFFFFSP